MQLITEYVQKNSAKIVLLFLLLWVLWIFLIFCRFSSEIHVLLLVIIGLIPFALFEISLRLVMFLAYGSQYPFSLFNYLVVDDPVYGLCFRRSCSIKELDFLLFDRMAFPPGTPRILDLKENIEQRVDVHVDSLGYRGNGFSPAGDPRRLRIFCLGGSTTACTSVGDEAAWPGRLMQWLSSKGYDAEVINGGVPSWYSFHDLLRFRSEVCQYGADVVLLHEGWNEEFLYSSLSLGRRWQPRLVRNVREEYNLYIPPNRLLSSRTSLTWFLMVQAYCRNVIFSHNMRFTNGNRWRVLNDLRYIRAWFENMTEMARIAEEKDLLLYNINYPGLVGLGDSSEEREVYVRNSRLTGLFADYQAVSKKRIFHVLSAMNPMIPCLDVEEDFKPYRGKDRLGFFYDEIHLTETGCSVFAEKLGQRLIGDDAFRARCKAKTGDGEIRSNVNVEPGTVKDIRRKISQNRPYLERFVLKRIEALTARKKGILDESMEVPHDRYTTF